MGKDTRRETPPEYNELVSTPASCDETNKPPASLLGGSAVVAE